MILRQSVGFWKIPSIFHALVGLGSEVDPQLPEDYRFWGLSGDDVREKLGYSSFLLDSGYTRMRLSTELFLDFIFFHVKMDSGTRLLDILSTLLVSSSHFRVCFV